MNLQDYLGANAGNLDEQATRLDEATFRQTPQADGTQPTSMSLGEYLARKRTASTDEGAAALLRGNVTDVMLARRGKSTARQPDTYDAAARNAEAEKYRQREADYWRQQQERNTGRAQQRDAEKASQATAYEASRRAAEDKAGGPGYRKYSQAVEKSYGQSRGRGVRVISQEEQDQWAR